MKLNIKTLTLTLLCSSAVIKADSAVSSSPSSAGDNTTVSLALTLDSGSGEPVNSGTKQPADSPLVKSLNKALQDKELIQNISKRLFEALASSLENSLKQNIIPAIEKSIKELIDKAKFSDSDRDKLKSDISRLKNIVSALQYDDVKDGPGGLISKFEGKNFESLSALMTAFGNSIQVNSSQLSTIAKDKGKDLFEKLQKFALDFLNNLNNDLQKVDKKS